MQKKYNSPAKGTTYIGAFVSAMAVGFLVYNAGRTSSLHHIHLPVGPGSTTTQFGQDAHSILSKDTEAARKALSTRVCGSPAVDGYAHVDIKCLETSPTAKWTEEYIARGGRYEDFAIYIEERSDYDGLAVAWGIDNKKTSAEECAAACRAHRPKTVGGPFEKLPCNAFAWCPFDTCFEPDAHTHTKGDCWLKFTEAPASPEVNMRGELPDWYRRKHSNAPQYVHWVSGVLLPVGVDLTNGTWSPRWQW